MTDYREINQANWDDRVPTHFASDYLDHTRRTSAWSSGLASRTLGERSAATAADRASLGWFLLKAAGLCLPQRGALIGVGIDCSTRWVVTGVTGR